MVFRYRSQFDAVNRALRRERLRDRRDCRYPRFQSPARSAHNLLSRLSTSRYWSSLGRESVADNATISRSRNRSDRCETQFKIALATRTNISTAKDRHPGNFATDAQEQAETPNAEY